jgi:hypothetical protein
MPQDSAVAPVITASGTNWAQYKAGGLLGLMDRMISTNAAKANPTTTATATATGGGASGGSLPAGTYFIRYSWVDAFGETLAAGVSSQLTVAAGNIPRITIPSLPAGVSFANIYLTPTGGADGTQYLYATGITTTTFDASYALPVDVPGAGMPQANTTGAQGSPEVASAIPSAFTSRANNERFWCGLHELLSVHLRGAPVSRRDYLLTPFWRRGVVTFMSTALAEVVTLVVANQGTLGWSTPGSTGVGYPVLSRTL